jgi:AraC-like DNA-binding protein
MDNAKIHTQNTDTQYRSNLQINLRWAYRTHIPEAREAAHTVVGVTTWFLEEGQLELITSEGLAAFIAPCVLVMGPGKRAHRFSSGCLLSSVNCQIQDDCGDYFSLPPVCLIPLNSNFGEDTKRLIDGTRITGASLSVNENRLRQARMHELLARWVSRLAEVLVETQDEPFSARIEHPRLARAIRWLNDSPANHTFTETQVAQYAGLSVSHFKRLLKEEMKRSFLDLMLERKLSACEDLLLRSNLPIKNVALDLGFKEPSNFVRWFRKNTGNTPARYRKLHMSRQH